MKLSKRILSSHNCRHYFHIRRCIIHKTNIGRGEIFKTKRLIYRPASESLQTDSVDVFIAVRKFFICTCWQECQKISEAIIKEEIKPAFPAAGPTLYKRPAGDVRHLHSLCIGTSVWLSENCRNKDEILNQGGPFLFFSFFLNQAKSIAADKTHHMDKFPKLASKINIQLWSTDG